MYNLIVFLKQSQIQYSMKFKEKGVAMAARQNILDRRKEYTEKGVDLVATTKGDDGNIMDLWASDIQGLLVIFQAEAFNNNILAPMARA